MRKVVVERDQIVTVRTALGVATIIQVPDKPNSVVVGDMNAFKVEYLDEAITIKPLGPRSRSNLYIYTDYRRFNVQLVAGTEASADYVVYLESSRSKPRAAEKPKERIIWKPLARQMTNEGLTFRSSRIGASDDGIVFVEFTLASENPVAIKPDWFWLTQGGNSRPIDGLVLSSLKCGPKNSLHGLMTIRRSDLNEKLPLKIELRRKKTSFFSVEVSAWKR
ncbi:MAG: TrbG/VirB9 family P-type conjugative transfer protein [Bdellovibrionales bacterium]|nr:TrbG/VirB9 family P-type conjugative transfer protein [Bdellovibrionales bacterium]